MSRKVLGLDIRHTSVAAVLVKSSLRESWIIGAMSVPIPPADTDPQGLRAALAAVAAAMDLDQTDCAVSIPASLFSSRNLVIPFDQPKKIRMVLPFELEAHLPNPAEDIAVDFDRLSGAASGGGSEVLAVAVEKARLAPFLADLAAAGFEPERLAPSVLAFGSLIARAAEPEETVLSAEVGDRCGALTVARQGQVRLLRTFPLPPAAEARRLAVRSQIRTTLAAVEELWPDAPAAARVRMTGSGLAGIDLPALAAELPVDLEPADLGRALNVAWDADDPAAWQPALMDGALAMAMAEIEGLGGLNFHRSQFPGKKILSRHREHLVRTGVLAAVVLAIMLGSLIGRSVIAKNRLAALDRQMAAVLKESFPEVQKITDPFQQMQISLQDLKKATALAGENRTAPRAIDVLKNLSESIPPEVAVVIERLVIGPEAVTIAGTTAGFNAVDDIKGRLERIPGFKKVTINSANTDRSGKEVNFQLKVDL
jgi:general secretion pathway protein L